MCCRGGAFGEGLEEQLKWMREMKVAYLGVWVLAQQTNNSQCGRNNKFSPQRTPTFYPGHPPQLTVIVHF